MPSLRTFIGMALIALLLASCEGYTPSPSDNNPRRHGGTGDEDRDRTRDQNR